MDAVLCSLLFLPWRRDRSGYDGGSELTFGIATVAGRMGIPLTYARMLWFFGTIIAWPIGLYVMATGRLVLATKEHTPVSKTVIDRPVKPRPSKGMAPRQPDQAGQTQNQQPGLEV